MGGGGHNLPYMLEIGLTDLPKPEVPILPTFPSAHPSPTFLHFAVGYLLVQFCSQTAVQSYFFSTNSSHKIKYLYIASTISWIFITWYPLDRYNVYVYLYQMGPSYASICTACPRYIVRSLYLALFIRADLKWFDDYTKELRITGCLILKWVKVNGSEE